MIKRYTLDPEMFALVAHEDGEVVDYNDHLAAIKAAKVEAVRGFAEWCNKGGSTPFGDDAKYMTEAFIKELSNEE